MPRDSKGSSALLAALCLMNINDLFIKAYKDKDFLEGALKEADLFFAHYRICERNMDYPQVYLVEEFNESHKGKELKNLFAKLSKKHSKRIIRRVIDLICSFQKYCTLVSSDPGFIPDIPPGIRDLLKRNEPERPREV